MLKEFKEFAIKGNMMDMAVGIIIGAAFGTVVTSLVNDLLMPVISAIIGSNHSVVRPTPAGAASGSVPAPRDGGAVVLALGLFINAIISFLIVSAALFFVVKMLNRLRRQEEAAPAAPPQPTAEVRLLGEIRDLLQRR